jgi:hypothetical protein
MLEAANHLEFEKAALLRDQIRELKSRFASGPPAAPAGVAAAATKSRPVRYRTPRRRTRA